MLKKVILSAPFGNWLRFEGATSTLGTYTWHYRGGLLWRAWKVLETLRYGPSPGSYVNKLGLPNPGLWSLPPANYSSNIISIMGFNASEWQSLAEYCEMHTVPMAVELNLSCPNVAHSVVVSDALPAVDLLLKWGRHVIAKLPPIDPMALAAPMYAAGVRTFHCCNTIPSPAGGISGAPLKPLSIAAIRLLRERWGESVRIIGGGGVFGSADAADYVAAGADHVSVASALLNPLSWYKVTQIIKQLGG